MAQVDNQRVGSMDPSMLDDSELAEQAYHNYKAGNPAMPIPAEETGDQGQSNSVRTLGYL